MKKTVLTCVVLFGACAAQAWNYTVSADHADCLYELGETARFTLAFADPAGGAVTGRVTVTLDNFGAKRVFRETFDLARTNPIVVSGKLDEPGFLRLTANNPGTNGVNWSVGVAPRAIRPGAPRPADFDQYWDGEIARLAREVPLDPQMTLEPARSKGAVDHYRVSFATFGGRRVHGFLSVPKDAAKGRRYPVGVTVPGAGPGAIACWDGAPDRVQLTMNVHAYAPAADSAGMKQLYKEQDAALKAKWGVDSYAVAGIGASREDCFFHDAILGINRAVDWLAAQPFADPADVTYAGSSQGGAFGFFLCGLNAHFRKGVMYVPAMCDHLAFKVGRANGWPQFVSRQPSADAKANAEKWAPYFDACNFAPRIKIPVRVLAGLSDTTCCPSSVYAAFNALASVDKEIANGIGMPHSVRREFYRDFGAWQRAKEFTPAPDARPYENRWVFAIQYLNTDEQLAQTKALVTRAKACGCTGLAIIPGTDYTSPDRDFAYGSDEASVRAARTGLDDLAHMDKARIARFRALKAHCDAVGFDFVPLVWSTGYCSMQNADPAFAACWPVKDAPYVVKGGKGVFAPEPVAADVAAFNRTVDCAAKDAPGRSVSVKFPVKPCRKYRFSVQVKTENVPKKSVYGGVGCAYYATGNAKNMADSVTDAFDATQDWTPSGLTFFTGEGDTEVTFTCSVPYTDGKVSVKDAELVELGIEYPLRRAGTTFVVRDAATGAVYREGKDYAAVPSAGLLRTTVRTPAFTLDVLPGGAIREGARLLVSAYEPKCVYGRQHTACFTNPALKEYYRKSAADLARAFGVTKWFMSADEIRVGCRCENCRANKETAGVRVGKDYRAQYDAIKAACPEADVYMWPDMTDVNHNAMKNYYLMGDMRGALDYVPKDVTMVCWWGTKAMIELPYFTARGYRTMGAGFYDKTTAEKTRASAKEWIAVINETPRARGLMYTTWFDGVGKNFAFLEDFMDEVNARGRAYVPTRGGAWPKRVMSYNVCSGHGDRPRHGIPKDDPAAHLEEAAAVIRRVDPDWCAVQEVDVYAKRTERVDQAHELARRTGMFPVYGQAIKHAGGQDAGAYGVMLLSKEKPLAYRVVPLPDRHEDRVLLVCEFEKYVVVATHFALQLEDQLAAARKANELAAACTKPVFLAGDLNARPDSPVIAELKKRYTALSDNTVPTWPTDGDLKGREHASPRAIDWIFVDTPHASLFANAKGRVLPDRRPSDHFPIAVSFDAAPRVQVDPQGAYEKKYIACGWEYAYMTPQDFIDHADQFLETPLDGVSINVLGGGKTGLPRQAYNRIISTNRWTKAQLAHMVEPMRKMASYPCFRESILGGWYPPQKRLAWTDAAAWDAVSNNLACVAWLARAGGFKHLRFDIEDYFRQRQFNRVDDDPPYDELVEFVRERARAVGRGIFAEYPDISLFMYWVLSDAPYRHLETDLPALVRARGDLWPAFVNGLLDVMPSTAQLVDGEEDAYKFEHAQHDFLGSYNRIFNWDLPLVAPENRVKYLSQVSPAFGLYIDPYVNDEKNSWYMPPEDGSRVTHFARNLRQATSAAQKYVWFWSEKGRWTAWSEKLRNDPERLHRSAKVVWNDVLPGILSAMKAIKDPEGYLLPRLEKAVAAGVVRDEIAVRGLMTWKNSAPKGKDGKPGVAPGRLFRENGEWRGEGLEFGGCHHQLITNVVPGDVFLVKGRVRGEHTTAGASFKDARDKWFYGKKYLMIPGAPDAEGWRSFTTFVTVPEGGAAASFTFGFERMKPGEISAYRDLRVYCVSDFVTGRKML